MSSTQHNLKEKTLILIKPDALQRNLLGEIIQRFERKGLKIVAMKMIHLGDALIEEHYGKYRDRDFFQSLKNFMQSSPLIALILEGLEAIQVTRLIVGPTSGRVADAGSIRGDLSMSTQTNIIHASDSVETAQEEIKRFFKPEEIFEYKKADYEFTYGEEERK